MTIRLVLALLVAALVLPGFAPARCPGPDCPCAASGEATRSSCCPEDDACAACLFCDECGMPDPGPPAIASAPGQPLPTRVEPTPAIPGLAPPACAPAGDHPPDPVCRGPARRVSRHVPSVVLRV